MPYDEQSFLNGLAAGLTATGGTMRGRYYGNGYYVLPYLPGYCTAGKISSAGTCVYIYERMLSGSNHFKNYDAVRKCLDVVKCTSYGPNHGLYGYATQFVFACSRPISGVIADVLYHDFYLSLSHGTYEVGNIEKIEIVTDSVYNGTLPIYYKVVPIRYGSWGLQVGGYNHKSLEDALNVMDDGKWLF